MLRYYKHALIPVLSSGIPASFWLCHHPMIQFIFQLVLLYCFKYMRTDLFCGQHFQMETDHQYAVCQLHGNHISYQQTSRIVCSSQPLTLQHSENSRSRTCAAWICQSSVRKNIAPVFPTRHVPITCVHEIPAKKLPIQSGESGVERPTRLFRDAVLPLR